MAVVIDPPYGYAETKKMRIKGVENPAWDTVGNARRSLNDAMAQTRRIVHDHGLVFVFAPYELIGQFERGYLCHCLCSSRGWSIIYND